MGYLDNRVITVDAILTKKGRQLLSQGIDFFKITKFALADDEVDYHLWNTAHPSGSNYYGYAIEQMPVLEPSPDETQCMRYKLVSLPKDTVKIPVVSVTPTSIIFTQGQEVLITPQTTYAGGSSQPQTNLNGTFGYTAILHNSDVGWLNVATPAPRRKPLEDRTDSAEDPPRTVPTGGPTWLGDTDSARSVTAVGMVFKLTAKQVNSIKNLSTTLTIIGNETGGSTTISVTNRAVRIIAQ